MTEYATPTVVPFLMYEDGAAAIDFLTKAFGFNERYRLQNDDGSIGHAELSIGDDGVVFLASGLGAYESPKHHAENCERARSWQDTPYIINGVYLQVDDIHAHFDNAKAAGATILSAVEDSGHGVLYRAADLEGQRWMFSQRPDAAS
ncbi:VOC family protein [Tenggerimyces flavus]|uniref:VOC family protein n=1 Tax=Tenggerimyces flavus TaxID=1708749 RepID=A0ABV7Y681_9ACTN|nr:VOC family protein [Tenggerimyces flavus]MBM7788216.1 PhnB protein [Tenggerimyces flavus]